jgi:Ca-activated chloride channel homolog
LEYRPAVTWASYLALVVGVLAVNETSPISQTPPVATFRSSVDLVRVSAIVRDQKGRFVPDLGVKDFEILDANEPRRIVDFRRDASGLSLALLFDVSGSMESRLPDAREQANHVLSWLDGTDDEAAVYTFDTKLIEVAGFTTGLKAIPPALSNVMPFGATSLHDAIAQTARRVAVREGRRRAVAVVTDGRDNASQLKAAQVSAIASAIDVPVYIFGVVASIDDPAAETATTSATHSSLKGDLVELSERTGGRVFVASTPSHRSLAARQMLDELRHQYLLAFESSLRPGWHPLVVRARGKDLVVRARNGYMAGQSRPNSF